ncbi:hypothetical protein CC1G_01987 [Coprinopsis cinerea okayama7|uniref:Uncharacterized protein n=1 Tax=Coprinopsis cinerea (strain Okayama-7 / 130 / ATCC MYA-4618 / FGSC 9003) TaxID=240176 RepID=A8N675_COPC7|nr:hypothetical protein CC1G_01987 [Coprinopsis cinerea okayama7\|eukprot:XP_001830351.1 hypothetical protein CC1G_01987 [Coprinopsis cinerea okayama7\
MSSTVQAERELGNNQRGLVDNIIDENQYEAAISTLFQLRSPQHKPYPAHIQQLIFLGLHPSIPTPEKAPGTIHETPRRARQTRVQFPITPKAVTSALDLLTSLIATNSPESIGRALPSYSTQEHNHASDDQTDSLLAKQALCIKTAKHCWEFLEEGYIHSTQVITSPQAKSKLRRDSSFEEALGPNAVTGEAQLVGPDAWPILSWLVSLFERDEELNERNDSSRYSRILLEQLPPPRGGKSGTRWDFSDILNIVVHCFDQTDVRKKDLGYRLMALLVNLTNSNNVELETLVTSVYKRLMAAGRPDFFDLLLSNIPVSESVWRFKACLCLKVATDGISSKNDSARLRPRPQPRAPPRARPIAPDSPRKHVKPRDEVPKIALPDVMTIVECLESPIPDALPEPLNKALVLHTKFELVLSFASAQKSNLAVESRLEWDRLIQDGQLSKSLNIGFGPDSGETGSLYLGLLREYLRLGS